MRRNEDDKDGPFPLPLVRLSGGRTAGEWAAAARGGARAAVCCAVLSATAACAEVRFFDMGTADSKVYEGATRDRRGPLSADTGYGWRSAEGLAEQARAWEEMGDRRGSPAPPVMWTNAVTEDCITGESGNAFLIDLPDGDYRVYLLCGTSDQARYFVWDFTVIAHDAASTQAPGAEATGWVQMDGGWQHRPVRLRATVEAGTLSIDLGPRSRWVVSAVLVASEDEWARAEREIVDPLEEWTFFLPPHVQEDWKLDPRPEPEPMPELSQEDRSAAGCSSGRGRRSSGTTPPRAGRSAGRSASSPLRAITMTFCVNLLRDTGT